jgi:hypothetical protein
MSSGLLVRMSLTSILSADEHVHMVKNVDYRVRPLVIDSSVRRPWFYSEVVQSIYDEQ